MTPEITADNSIEPQKQAPSTAGMTTKVVKGSMWTLAGSVAPLAISFISTPFIIRFLGTESYGVLLLVGLIPTYFSFADFGMGVASTKFAAEAYGEGDEKKEAEIVWTATAIAAISALIVATPIFIFSYPIVQMLNVPEHLLTTASIALKITSGSFFVGILSSVLNSPMLARLRMDLNMLTSAGPKVLLAAVTPFILYFGGGIIEAVGWAFIVTLGILAVVIYFSTSLLPGLLSGTLNRNLIRPLLKFGGAWFIAMIAAMLLVNLEKLFLTKMVSVEALAYYSVAFTFANMATMFSASMVQSLVPAFSQLRSPEKQQQFHLLFSRMVRINVVGILPILLIMFLLAEPFFTVWAGSDFGRESTPPFYVLLVGLFFNLQATIPYIAVVASGRADSLARLYWLELIVYAGVALVLISWIGIIGAALAWMVRVALDAFAILHFSKRFAGVTISYSDVGKKIALGSVILSPPLTAAILSNNLFLVIPLLLISVALYFFVAWVYFFDSEERKWLAGQYLRVHGRFAGSN